LGQVAGEVQRGKAPPTGKIIRVEQHVLELITRTQEYQLILDHQRHVLQSAFKVWVGKADVSIEFCFIR
jgi:hypothetical protein